MKHFYESAMIIAYLLISLTSAHSQTGAWIEHSFTTFGSGSRLYKCGENCIIYTQQNATKVIFFDINSSAWSELDFAATQHFYNVLANGNVAFTFSDSFLVAYNAITSNWDTLRYEGEPVDTSNYISYRRSYQIGENLIMFVTDQKFYIFDVTGDGWQEYSYTLPANFTNGVFWIGDTYAGIMLNPSMDIPTNLAYSTYTQSFAETDRGMYLGAASEMADGFAGSYIYGSEDDYYLVGYSALTNEFSRIEVDADYAPESGIYLTENHHTEFTVYEATARTVITPYELVRYDVWCYDTRLAAWAANSYEFDPTENPGFGGWYLGGRYAYVPNTDNDADSMIVLYYSGLTGSFCFIETELGYFYPHGIAIQGRVTMAFGDSNAVYAYNFETGQTAITGIGSEYYRRNINGHDYLTFNRYDNTDYSTTYIYHGPSNTWTTINLENAYYGGYAAGSHIYTESTSGANCGTLFYSPILNETTWVDFSGSSSISKNSSDYLAIAGWTDDVVLYDARSGNTFEINIPNTTASYLTDNIMFASNTDDYTFYAYSSLTDTVSSLTVGSTPYKYIPKDYIGLGYVVSGGTDYYAYNGFYGNFVALDPVENMVGHANGGKTALVVRTYTLYAFDPEEPTTGMDEQADDPLPQTFSLAQNYPNPFNDATIINYNLPTSSDVTIEIYDILGRLVDSHGIENQPAGNHQYHWQADNVSSGVYFYKLEAGAVSETKKMVLLK